MADLVNEAFNFNDYLNNPTQLQSSISNSIKKIQKINNKPGNSEQAIKTITSMVLKDLQTKVMEFLNLDTIRSYNSFPYTYIKDDKLYVLNTRALKQATQGAFAPNLSHDIIDDFISKFADTVIEKYSSIIFSFNNTKTALNIQVNDTIITEKNQRPNVDGRFEICSYILILSTELPYPVETIHFMSANPMQSPEANEYSWMSISNDMSEKYLEPHLTDITEEFIAKLPENIIFQENKRINLKLLEFASYKAFIKFLIKIKRLNSTISIYTQQTAIRPSDNVYTYILPYTRNRGTTGKNITSLSKLSIPVLQEIYIQTPEKITAENFREQILNTKNIKKIQKSIKPLTEAFDFSNVNKQISTNTKTSLTNIHKNTLETLVKTKLTNILNFILNQNPKNFIQYYDPIDSFNLHKLQKNTLPPYQIINNQIILPTCAITIYVNTTDEYNNLISFITSELANIHYTLALTQGGTLTIRLDTLKSKQKNPLLTVNNLNKLNQAFSETCKLGIGNFLLYDLTDMPLTTEQLVIQHCNLISFKGLNINKTTNITLRVNTDIIQTPSDWTDFPYNYKGTFKITSSFNIYNHAINKIFKSLKNFPENFLTPQRGKHATFKIIDSSDKEWIQQRNTEHIKDLCRFTFNNIEKANAIAKLLTKPWDSNNDYDDDRI